MDEPVVEVHIPVLRPSSVGSGRDYVQDSSGTDLRIPAGVFIALVSHIIAPESGIQRSTVSGMVTTSQYNESAGLITNGESIWSSNTSASASPAALVLPVPRSTKTESKIAFPGEAQLMREDSRTELYSAFKTREQCQSVNTSSPSGRCSSAGQPEKGWIPQRFSTAIDGILGEYFPR